VCSVILVNLIKYVLPQSFHVLVKQAFNESSELNVRNLEFLD